jgi:hypothetical protein
MSEGGSRRAVAEIRFGEDRSGIAKVGGRSIHQYWSLLGPHFRDVLLAPQRRSDDGGVAWTWREASDRKVLTAAELAGVRKRLERANESFAENPVNALMGGDRSGTSSQVLVDQVAAKVKTMAESMAAKSDAALADFVCRTETGVMVHSWGVVSPAQVIYPDSLETGVGGVVMVGEKPSVGHEVVIENAQGLSVARMQSDESGEFHFSKIGPGRYRVRVVSGKVKFPAKGVMVTVERGTVARLELQSISNSNDQGESAANEAPDTSEETSPGALNSPKRRRGLWKVVVLLLAILLVGGSVWVWRMRAGIAGTEQSVAAHSSSMKPEEFAHDERKPNAASRSNSVSGDNDGLGVSVDGVGTPRPRPVEHSTNENQNHRIPRNVTGERSSSTIGSKIEVLSGVSDALTPEENHEEDATQSAAIDAAANQQSVPGISGASSPERTNTLVQSQQPKNVGAATGSSRLGANSQGDSAPSGTPESVAMNGQKPLASGKPDGKLPATTGLKRSLPRPAEDAVPVDAPPAGTEFPNDEISSSGPASGDVPQSENLATERTRASEPRAKGPAVKVSVVRKVESAEENADRKEATAEAKNGKPSSKNTPTKRNKASPGSRSSEALRGTTSASDSSATPPVEQSSVADEVAAPETKSVGEPSKPEANAAGGLARADDPKNADATAVEAAKPPASAGGSERAIASQRRSARVPNSSNNPTLVNDQNAPRTSAQENASTEPETEEPEAVQSEGGNREMISKSELKTIAVKVQMSGWETRLVRDVIVPTLPVRTSEIDTSESMRKKLVADQKARLPDLLQRPLAMRGFTFELPLTPAKEIPYWDTQSGSGFAQKVVSKTGATVSWVGAKPPLGTVHVLRFSDGSEVVRITVNTDGGVSLKTADGIRGSFWLSVAQPENEKVGLAPRFGWRVNGVARKSEEPKSGEHDYRISFPLESRETKQMEVALADRVTGWALVAMIQLQPSP